MNKESTWEECLESSASLKVTPNKANYTDYKIVWNLDYNARMSLSELAQKTNLSKQNLNYQIKKLINKNVLLGFMSVVDIHHLGNLTYRILLPIPKC